MLVSGRVTISQAILQNSVNLLGMVKWCITRLLQGRLESGFPGSIKVMGEIFHLLERHGKNI